MEPSDDEAVDTPNNGDVRICICYYLLRYMYVKILIQYSQLPMTSIGLNESAS